MIPASKTKNGIAEIPLTPSAVEAFKSHMRISGTGPFLFPSDKNPSGHHKTLDRLAENVKTRRSSLELPTSGSMICAQPMQLDSVRAVLPTRGLLNSSGRATPVFKKYSQMKLQMKRQALEKMNRRGFASV
jgi:hypothetical protein